MVADIITGSLVRSKSRAYKSYLTYFIPPLQQAGEHFRNGARNLANFVRQRLHQDFGMKELIYRFYESVRGHAPVPIPYREIILTARIMDEIFAQTYSVSRDSDVAGIVARSDVASAEGRRVAVDSVNSSR
jgi:hypothetical protein